jgi:hypothetical protein
MNLKVILVILFLCCISCKNDREANISESKVKPESEMMFDKDKWRIKEGKDYPYRDKMLNDIVYNDTVRILEKDEVLNLFGEPSYYRDSENFLYYRITETRIASWIIHSKTMVIKLSEENTVDWIKIHK